jgi:hypothetical protein
VVVFTHLHGTTSVDIIKGCGVSSDCDVIKLATGSGNVITVINVWRSNSALKVLILSSFVAVLEVELVMCGWRGFVRRGFCQRSVSNVEAVVVESSVFA